MATAFTHCMSVGHQIMWEVVVGQRMVVGLWGDDWGKQLSPKDHTNVFPWWCSIWWPQPPPIIVRTRLRVQEVVTGYAGRRWGQARQSGWAEGRVTPKIRISHSRKYDGCNQQWGRRQRAPLSEDNEQWKWQVAQKERGGAMKRMGGRKTEDGNHGCGGRGWQAVFICTHAAYGFVYSLG